MHLAEFLAPCFTVLVERAYFLSRERVLDHSRIEVELTVFALGEELAGAVAEQFMKSNDQSQRVLEVLHHQFGVLFAKELDGLQIGLWVNISQVDILEALVHPDVVVVRNVDANRSSTASKGHDVQIGKVGLGKPLLFKGRVPRQFWDEVFGVCHQLVELGGSPLVDQGNETLKLSPSAQGVHVRLDKADVRLDDWAGILDPQALRLFMRVNVPEGEVLLVRCHHLPLGVVRSELGGPCERVTRLPHEGAQVTS